MSVWRAAVAVRVASARHTPRDPGAELRCRVGNRNEMLPSFYSLRLRFVIFISVMKITLHGIYIFNER